MKFSKMINKLIQTVLFLFIFCVLCGVIYSTVSGFINSYNLVNAKRGSETVVAETAEKGLFHTPAYYVKVDMNDNNPNDVYDGVLNRVSALEIKKLEDGDQIKGFIIDNHHFLTLYDIVFDSFWAVLGIVTLLFLILVTLIWGISIFFPIKERLSKKDSKNVKKRKRRKSGGKEKSFSFQGMFLVVFFIGTFLFTCTFMLNGFHKLIPLGQTKTEAVIMDKRSEREWLVYSARPEYTADPLFELELYYTDQAGMLRRVVKEVTPQTFNNYQMFEEIPIVYRNNNPLDVFIRGTSLGDVLNFFVYGRFIFFSLVSLAAIVIGTITFWRLYKKVKRKFYPTMNGK